MTNRKILAALLAIIVSSAFWTASTFAQAAQRARIIHAASNLPAIDVYLNGELAVGDLSYGEDSAYFSLPTGAAELRAYIADTTTQLSVQTLNLENATSAIVLSSSAGAPASIIADDLSPLEFGMTRLLIVNALEDDSDIDISSSADERLSASNMAPGASLGSFELPAGQVEFNLLRSSANDESARRQFSATLSAGTSNILLIHGDSDDPQLMRARAAADAAPHSGHVRFVHAVQGAAPIDLQVNGRMIVPSLAFANPSEHIALPKGSHELKLSLRGAVISSLSLDVNAGEMQTVAVMGTPASLSVFTYPDSLRDLKATSTVVSLINAVPNGSVSRLKLDSGAIVAADVAFGVHGGAAQIVPGAQSLSMTLEIGDDRGTVEVPAIHFYPGSYYSLIALPGSAFSAPRLLIAETSLMRHLTATLPTVSVSTDDEPELITEDPADDIDEAETLAPAEEAAESLAAPDPETEVEPMSPADAEPVTPGDSVGELEAPADSGPTLVSGPYAIVDLDPGARLQLRQYPSSDAMSLGLLPGGTELTVLGRRGLTVFHAGETPDLPVDLSGYHTDPAAALYPAQDLQPAETWLFVIHQTEDGGAVVGWVNALYLQVYDTNGEMQRLASLPMVRQNRAGSGFNTEMRPPDLSDHVTAHVYQINPGALLNLRMANSADSEVLAQLPLNASLSLVGLDASDAWAYVDYEAADGKIYRGWVSAAYVQLLLNAEPVQVSTLRALDETVAPHISDQMRGSIRSGETSGPTPIPPTDDMMKGIVGEVALDPGAMLHLRRHPNIDAESLAMIPAGTKVTISGITQSTEWLKASYREKDGWISAHYVALLLRGRLYHRNYVESLLPLHDNRGVLTS
ncbi:MAG: DUF4397 domain-containing protein [Chloroflexi bacterium]|nr:DUF4397 domain-containing protein [Chloroflexota bacterium]